jgi:hypothetical protein
MPAAAMPAAPAATRRPPRPARPGRPTAAPRAPPRPLAAAPGPATRRAPAPRRGGPAAPRPRGLWPPGAARAGRAVDAARVAARRAGRPRGAAAAAASRLRPVGNGNVQRVRAVAAARRVLGAGVNERPGGEQPRRRARPLRLAASPRPEAVRPARSVAKTQLDRFIACPPAPPVAPSRSCRHSARIDAAAGPARAPGPGNRRFRRVCATITEYDAHTPCLRRARGCPACPRPSWPRPRRGHRAAAPPARGGRQGRLQGGDRGRRLRRRDRGGALRAQAGARPDGRHRGAPPAAAARAAAARSAAAATCGTSRASPVCGACWARGRPSARRGAALTTSRAPRPAMSLTPTLQTPHAWAPNFPPRPPQTLPPPPPALARPLLPAALDARRRRVPRHRGVPPPAGVCPPAGRGLAADRGRRVPAGR